MASERFKDAPEGVSIGNVETSLFDRINSGEAKKGKRRVNTHSKMKRSQRECGEMLIQAFSETYIQTPGSGAYATFNKGKLSKEDASVLAGDIRVSNMLCLIEVKAGYDHINLMDLFFYDDERGGKASKNELRSFFEEVERYEKDTGKTPLIIWRQTRKPWVCIFHESMEAKFSPHIPPNTTRMRFDGWIMIPLGVLLNFPKELLFDVPASDVQSS